MKNKLIYALYGSILLGLHAEIVKNPDPGTLWQENGTNMKFSTKAYSGDWLNVRCRITPENNGFLLEPKDGSKAYTGICVPVSPEFPYLEFDLEIVEKKNGFYFLTDVVNMGPHYSLGKAARSGRYYYNVYENAPKLAGRNGKVFFEFRVYNGKVRIKNLRMVKEPVIRLILKSEQLKTDKVLTYWSELDFLVPEKQIDGKKISLQFFEAQTGKELEFNHAAFPELIKSKKHPGYYGTEFKVETFSRKKLAAGNVLIEIKGVGKPVYTWLPYTWDPREKTSLQKVLPEKYDWIKDLRTDHPRIFINRDILPEIKKYAAKIGYRQIIEDANQFEIDPKLVEKRRGAVGAVRPYDTVLVTLPRLYQDEALTCALAYLLTDDKKYVEKAWRFLDHNLAVYKACAEKRTAISWYGLHRIENMAALDWIWNASDPARCKKYLKEFIDVNIRYARHGWYGPFHGVNGGSGRTSGFYGDSNTELYMGVLAYKEGVCDDLAVDMLKKGYDKYHACLSFREEVAEDDGVLATTAMGYSGGQYPWVSYDFLYLWRAAFRKPVKLPVFNHLLYYSEWFQWNILPGKGNVKLREFGIGDNAKKNMGMFSITGHLYNILGVYGNVYPAESAQIAKAIMAMDGFFGENPKEKKRIIKRKIAPRYYYGFYRRYLSYGLDGFVPPAKENTDQPSQVLARHFPIGGLVFMRSGKKADSTYALFNVGSSLVSHKTRGDENHFTIFRKGYLAIDSGYRMDAWYAPLKYHRSSIAHNTMLIHDPDEKFTADENVCRATFKMARPLFQDTPEQDQLFKQHEPYLADAQGSQDKALGGKCTAFSTNSYYSYICGDATPVYSAKKCKEFNRQFIHIQPDVFLVFDRVESTDPTFKKEWLLHFLEEPVVKGNVTVAKVTDEGGIIRCTTLLPEHGVIKKIGGPGKEFMGTNVNWNAPQKVLKNVKYGGAWRISLSPGKASKRDYFLNVLDVGDHPVKDIRSTEDAESVTVTFTTVQGRKVTATFRKSGATGGRIRVEEKGKVLCDEALRQNVQPQAGFLY
ncbi:MAG: heparinase II/III family protein [Lentisphaeria bacterium]|nr:heparinase II/III family protein [Lentisphaeria bacterium]